jgi:putative colanic acid biosynthesis acetyltransferase WcaF
MSGSILPQKSAFDSPWPLKKRAAMLAWEYVWLLLCAWTPKPANPWRLLVLRLFGAKIHGRPFVHQRVRIQIPWNLTLHDRACLGDRTNVYSLGEIEIGERATVAQEAYLCSGTHDFSQQALDLIVEKITIGPQAFIGARAFILPGVAIGEGAVIGACAVVTKDMPAWTICAGQPCKPQKARPEVSMGCN